MAARDSLHKRIVAISEDYLGPAAQRFVDRIALNHLNKSAEQLEYDDLPELITWVQLAANVMTENTAAIDEYAQRLKALQKSAKADIETTGVGMRLNHSAW